MKAATATSTTTRVKDAEGLLRFNMKAYQPRGVPPALAVREPAVPQSIKDAIVRWLDEQL